MCRPAGDGLAWLAGEARVVAQAREIVLGKHRQPREALRAAAYWKQNTAAFHGRLDD